eukprot:scaffold21131_cov18-Phaeocystis_antarctica.AAC.1
MCPLINTPTHRVIISQPIFRFLGVSFDGDHDFEGLRSPRAHLDTVLRNLSRHLGAPRSRVVRRGGMMNSRPWRDAATVACQKSGIYPRFDSAAGLG